MTKSCTTHHLERDYSNNEVKNVNDVGLTYIKYYRYITKIVTEATTTSPIWSYSAQTVTLRNTISKSKKSGSMWSTESWRDAGAVERTCLENKRLGNGTVGSNPTPSAQ